MKTGQLTFHACHNFGGVLQCLALQKALGRLGVEAEAIDYNPAWKMRWLQAGSRLLVRRYGDQVMDMLGERRFGAAHYRAFRAFRRQHLKLSPPCGSVAALRRQARTYDALVVGSDQVWNGEWHWPVYFLDFATRYTGRKISYAACFGHDRQPPRFLKRVPAWLEGFTALSVRNQLSRAMVQRLSGRDAALVADPTLLVDLREVAVPPPRVQGPFILVYALKTDRVSESAAIVGEVKRCLKLPVVSVTPGSLVSAPFPGADLTVDDAGPAEWVWLMAHANCICTDSFHGALFALKYRKPLVVFDHRSRGSQRLYDVADRLGFGERLVSDVSQVARGNLCDTPVDTDVYLKLDRLVAASYAFLKSALGLPGTE